MARPLRIEYPGAIYHIMARGNERRAIFRSDSDRHRFLEKLRELRKVHRIDIYAYALMTNHYHLVVCTPCGNLTSFMQQFQTSYTMYFNRRHGRTGHLFAGRYKAPLVEGGHYLLRLTRYVHLNPVKTTAASELNPDDRQKMLREYRWSSLGGYAGLSPVEDWISYGVLDAFHDIGNETKRRKEYLRFVEEALEEDDDAFLDLLNSSSKACGSEAFRHTVEERYKNKTASLDRYVDVSMRKRETPITAAEITAAVAETYGLSETDLLRRGNREPKDLWIRLLYEESGLSQREIGLLAGHCDGSTVSRSLARIASTMAEDETAENRYQALHAKITNSKA